MSKSFEELISKANQKTLKKVSVSNAQDEPVLQAVKAAKEQNIATAILVGDEAKIREIAASIDMDLTDFEIINEPDTEAAALKAVELVHNGEADILGLGDADLSLYADTVRGVYRSFYRRGISGPHIAQQADMRAFKTCRLFFASCDRYARLPCRDSVMGAQTCV